MMAAAKIRSRGLAAGVGAPPATKSARFVKRLIVNPALQQVLVVVAILAIWQGVSGPILNPYYLSTPSAVFDHIVRWVSGGVLWPHLISTISTTTLGFGIAAGIAIPLALLITDRPFIDAVVSPFIYAIYSMPKIVLAPALILWLGVGQLPAVTLAAITAFFLVFFNLYLGLKSVPRVYTDTAALMGASRVMTALKFRLPAASTYLATGISQGLIYAFHGALVGEMTSSNTGMGYLILFAGSQMDSTGVMAGLCIVGLLAVLLTRLLARGLRVAGGDEPGPSNA